MSYPTTLQTRLALPIAAGTSYAGALPSSLDDTLVTAVQDLANGKMPLDCNSTAGIIMPLAAGADNAVVWFNVYLLKETDLRRKDSLKYVRPILIARFRATACGKTVAAKDASQTWRYCDAITIDLDAGLTPGGIRTFGGKDSENPAGILFDGMGCRQVLVVGTIAPNKDGTGTPTATYVNAFVDSLNQG